MLLYTGQLVIYLFILLQAPNVETEMKNLNIQVTLLVRKGVGTRSVFSWSMLDHGSSSFSYPARTEHIQHG